MAYLFLVKRLAIPAIAGLVFSMLPLHAQGPSILGWQDGVRLSWTDFQGRPHADAPGFQGAESSLAVSIQLSCTNDVPDLEVRAEFNRDLSWARPDMPASLLQHEQIHFDIAELYVRQTERQFSRIADPCNNVDRVEALSDRNNAAMMAEHETYDQETFHGTRATPQANWTRRVNLLLRATD